MASPVVARPVLPAARTLAPPRPRSLPRARIRPLPPPIDTTRPWLIMLSGTPWSPAGHRQQALARELSRGIAGNFRVLYVDPPARRPGGRFEVRRRGVFLWHTTVPTVTAGRALSSSTNRINRWLEAALLRRWLDQRPGERLLWVDDDCAVPVIGHLGESSVIVDSTESSSTAARHLRERRRHALETADLVLIPATTAAPATRRPPVVVGNGCDAAFLQQTGSTPKWLDALPRPRLGYLGPIDSPDFDGELLAAVARVHPEWNFVLAGAFTLAARTPFTGLPNIHLIGTVPFSAAPALVQGIDVGILPTRAANELAYPYLAMGKPVVTAAPTEVLDGAVRFAAGPDEFAAAITLALAEANSPEAAARRRAVAEANSWPARGDLLRSVLAQLRPAHPTT